MGLKCCIVLFHSYCTPNQTQCQHQNLDNPHFFHSGEKVQKNFTERLRLFFSENRKVQTFFSKIKFVVLCCFPQIHIQPIPLPGFGAVRTACWPIKSCQSAVPYRCNQGIRRFAGRPFSAAPDVASKNHNITCPRLSVVLRRTMTFYRCSTGAGTGMDSRLQTFS